MGKCHKFYSNCQWTFTHFWSNMAPDTVLLTEVYWKCSTNNVRVCFTPLLQPTFQRDLKRKRNLQINFNSPAMASFYEHLCFHSREHLDPIMNDFLISIHTCLSSLLSFPPTSTALAETTNGTFHSS